MHTVVEKLKSGGNVIYSSKQVCARADDFAPVARNMNSPTEMFIDLEGRNVIKSDCELTLRKQNIYLKMFPGEARCSQDRENRKTIIASQKNNRSHQSPYSKRRTEGRVR